VVNGTPDYDAESGIIAVDPATGHTLWRRNDVEYAGLIAWNNSIVVRTSSVLIGLDPESGKTLWNLPLRAAPMRPTSRGRGLWASAYVAHNGKARLVKVPPRPSEFTVRSYGKYLVVGESKRPDHSTGLRVYTAGGRQ
jgi:outer membrane protein assembly factor BamB